MVPCYSPKILFFTSIWGRVEFQPLEQGGEFMHQAQEFRDIFTKRNVLMECICCSSYYLISTIIYNSTYGTNSNLIYGFKFIKKKKEAKRISAKAITHVLDKLVQHLVSPAKLAQYVPISIIPVYTQSHWKQQLPVLLWQFFSYKMYHKSLCIQHTIKVKW